VAYQKIREYRQATPPEVRIDALFCENDILAIGVLGAQLEAQLEQKQPENLAVIEFDEIDEASSQVCQLTSGFVE